MNSRPTSHGGVLLILLLVFSIVILSGLAFLIQSAAANYGTVRAKERSWQARLWAESAIEDAAARLLADPYWRAYGSDTSRILSEELPEGARYEARVTETHAPDRLVVEATGFSEGARFSVQQEVRLRMPFLFTLLAVKDIRLAGNAVVEGNADAGGEMTVFDQARITASARAGKSFNGAKENVSGGVTEGISADGSFDFAKVFAAVLLEKPRRIMGGGLTNMAMADTSIWIDGSADARGILIRGGCILVAGDLRIRGPFEVEGLKNRVALIVDGDLTIEEGVSLRATGPVVVRDAFTSFGRCVIQGSVFAKSIDAGAGFYLRADPELARAAIPGFSRTVKLGRYCEASSDP